MSVFFHLTLILIANCDIGSVHPEIMSQKIEQARDVPINQKK